MSDILEPLEEWLLGQPISEFPGRGKYDYHSRFRQATTYLLKQVHPQVEKGALLRDGLFLTDHGPDHIRTVIRRASLLVGEPNGRITPYEAYLLIMAAHVHDVGLILGRVDHEKRAAAVVKELSGILGDDAVEIRAIRGIAKAHGGTVGASKDTISALPVKDHVFGQLVRKQYLAAILRFADELADDRDRAVDIALRLNVIPPESEIHHQYAAHLHSVVIDHPARSIGLNFALTRDVAIRPFKKGGAETLLLDEIFERTLKMHRERIYCVRFMEGIVRFDTIDVKIDVFLSHNHLTPVHQIAYRLEEKGYPDLAGQGITDLCPELTWTGAALRDDLLNRESTDED